MVGTLRPASPIPALASTEPCIERREGGHACYRRLHRTTAVGRRSLASMLRFSDAGNSRTVSVDSSKRRRIRRPRRLKSFRRRSIRSLIGPPVRNLRFGLPCHHDLGATVAAFQYTDPTKHCNRVRHSPVLFRRKSGRDHDVRQKKTRSRWSRHLVTSGWCGLAPRTSSTTPIPHNDTRSPDFSLSLVSCHLNHRATIFLHLFSLAALSLAFSRLSATKEGPRPVSQIC